MHWVTVGDPGNAADVTGLGSVAEPFLIGRYEVTNDEYCSFLNGSAAGRRNLNGVADGPADGSEAASIRRLGGPGEFRYEVVPGMSLMPVTGLRWCDAARLANWLHNGGTAEADTETGAYDLTASTPAEFTAVPRSPGARVWIPTRDEWYKAAFYKAGGVDAGYWRYPTGSNSLPRACASDDRGIGIPDGRSANVSKKSNWPGGLRVGDGGCLTAVGSNGPPGPYDAFDMGGNVAEIVTVSEDRAEMSAVLGLCGGDAGTGVARLVATSQVEPPTHGRGGVRLARFSGSAEPYTPRPPIDYPPLPVRKAAAKLTQILSRVGKATREDSTANFFKRELAEVSGIKDLALAPAVPKLRDEVKQVLQDGLKAAAAYETELAEAMTVRQIATSWLLDAFVNDAIVNAAVAPKVRDAQRSYDAAREPILDRAAQLMSQVEALTAPKLTK
ncbi:MAG: SUMF1/EgtB/PvdO family nonheme iron enzyme [Planctomycetia bacterium]